MLIDMLARHVGDVPVRARLVISKSWFPIVAPAVEVGLVVLASLLAGTAYHSIVYGERGPIADFAMLGALTGLAFTIVFVFRGHYQIESFLSGRRGFSRLFNVWLYAFVGLVLVGFLTKSSDMISRGWLLLFFGGGLVAVTAFDAILHRYVAEAARAGLIEPRRLMLVGTRQDCVAYAASFMDRSLGISVIATTELPGEDPQSLDAAQLSAVLKSGVESARNKNVTDVVILIDAGRVDLLARVADGLRDLPAAVHLGGLKLIDHFPGIKAERVGMLRTLALARPPMTFNEQMAKRAVDIAFAGLGLVVVSPLLLLVALLIKIDSKGPVFFLQRRRGYNQAEFRIFKFRTMHTMDDGSTIVQASRHDARVTRIGRLLRRTNLDELPQLINVLRGEMSLVGPRPHAVAHDELYGGLIERYARRLNVKPGITGWAQVHGLRGPTEHEDQMRRRIAHDLYYVDNWSLALDLQILIMTVASRSAYRNAF